MLTSSTARTPWTPAASTAAASPRPPPRPDRTVSLPAVSRGTQPRPLHVSSPIPDSPLAARVSKALRKTSLRVWDPNSTCSPATTARPQVARALGESDALAVLLTPNFVSSPHLKAEMAVRAGFEKLQHRLTPVALPGRKRLPTGSDPDTSSARVLTHVFVSHSHNDHVFVE